MKILLIMPPCVPGQPFPPGVHSRLYPPLGLGYLASVLEEKGHSVWIADLFSLKWDYVSRVFDGITFDVVGISCLFPSRTSVYLLCDYIRKKFPDTRIVLGGPFITAMAEKILPVTRADAAVVGEGEVTFPEVVDSFEGKKSIKDIKGIAYMEEGRILRTPSREPIKDLDGLPFPAYHLYNRKSYLRYRQGGESNRMKPAEGIRWGSVMTTRSCDYGCNFCAVPASCGDVLRRRSGRNVAEEYELLVKEYGYRGIFVQDAYFPFGTDLYYDLSNEIIKRNIKVYWASNTRADNIDEENIRLAKKTGCCYLIFGVETGSPALLEKMNKGETLEHVENAINLCSKYEIGVGAHIMVGYPGENNKTVDETKQFLKKMKNKITNLNVHILTLFPGTGVYNTLLSNGVIKEEDFLAQTKKSIQLFHLYTYEHRLSRLNKWKKLLYSCL
ncbi:MAG: radical SAM protein [Elusimicrobiota bacterium]